MRDFIKIKIGAGIFLVFILGAAVGALGMNSYMKEWVRRLLMNEDSLRKTLILNHYAQELELTESQYHEIEQIVTESEMRMDVAIQTCVREIQTIMKLRYELVKVKLTPKQQKKLSDIFEKLRMWDIVERDSGD